MRFYRSLNLVLGLAVLAGGCSADKKEDGRPLSRRDADRQYRAKLLVLDDGKTTRDQIIGVMGDQPDLVSDDGHTLLYDWTVKDTDEELLQRFFVIAEFDAHGVLVRHQTFDREDKYGGLIVPEDAMKQFRGVP